jgi:hypothetical protein
MEMTKLRDSEGRDSEGDSQGSTNVEATKSRPPAMSGMPGPGTNASFADMSAYGSLSQQLSLGARPPPMAPKLSAALDGPTNQLTADKQQIISKFLTGDKNAAKMQFGGGDISEIVLNEITKYGPDNITASHKEIIIFEMNVATGKWRKLRRKLPIL